MIKFVPRASPEALNLLEWMLQYNPKKRPRPAQIMQHEFFHPKTLTGQPKTASLNDSTGGKDTTAETSISRVESIVLGNNNLQIKTRVLDQSP